MGNSIFSVSTRRARAPPPPTVPHNFESIIQDADNYSSSSLRDLSRQVQAGIFLNHKTEKYWVDRDFSCNCFMLYARCLSITWSHDNLYWCWQSLNETRDTSIEVAQLLNVCWLWIHGKFETRKLSPGVVYEVVFVLMLREAAKGWEDPVNVQLVGPDGSTQHHQENLNEQRRNRWIEIPAGEFTASPENNGGELQFSFCGSEGTQWKQGLVVKGVAIRPKSLN